MHGDAAHGQDAANILVQALAREAVRGDAVTDHAAQLERVAAYLLEHETMSGAQFRACMEGKPVEEAPVTTLFESDDQT